MKTEGSTVKIYQPTSTSKSLQMKHFISLVDFVQKCTKHWHSSAFRAVSQLFSCASSLKRYNGQDSEPHLQVVEGRAEHPKHKEIIVARLSTRKWNLQNHIPTLQSEGSHSAGMVGVWHKLNINHDLGVLDFKFHISHLTLIWIELSSTVCTTVYCNYDFV